MAAILLLRNNPIFAEQEKALQLLEGLGILGSPNWVRTSDLRINSPSLYRLSYRGIKEAKL